ncbi:hypothetical protein B0T25DRAFT_518389 [Lasiosphaeria hispida]|uniref:Uncharacterized protein n=1 Tax=Lasiosphaeria hispida TaxID=260671 RepID=A0AAJ0MEK7_9PEZI|nr:hypothetical protein B0T25DRAFT_518389 [Lasiosphaeria hispida]
MPSTMLRREHAPPEPSGNPEPQIVALIVALSITGATFLLIALAMLFRRTWTGWDLKPFPKAKTTPSPGDGSTASNGEFTVKHHTPHTWNIEEHDHMPEAHEEAPVPEEADEIITVQGHRVTSIQPAQPAPAPRPSPHHAHPSSASASIQHTTATETRAHDGPDHATDFTVPASPSRGQAQARGGKKGAAAAKPVMSGALPARNARPPWNAGWNAGRKPVAATPGRAARFQTPPTVSKNPVAAATDRGAETPRPSDDLERAQRVVFS